MANKPNPAHTSKTFQKCLPVFAPIVYFASTKLVKYEMAKKNFAGGTGTAVAGGSHFVCAA
jgi:hypothetical protein